GHRTRGPGDLQLVSRLGGAYGELGQWSGHAPGERAFEELGYVRGDAAGGDLPVSLRNPRWSGDRNARHDRRPVNQAIHHAPGARSVSLKAAAGEAAGAMRPASREGAAHAHPRRALTRRAWPSPRRPPAWAPAARRLRANRLRVC